MLEGCYDIWGILDHNFENVRRSEAQGNPRVFTDVVIKFMKEVDVIMEETIELVNEPELNYETLSTHLHQLQGRSASIGGCRMAAACRNSRQAINARDKARCLETVEQVKQEYHTLRSAFKYIVGVARYILAQEVPNMPNENQGNGA
ncbi:uncharacterized protein LOC123224703 isoform X2 [Mangifera indica]|uniref:uncharacterized protein LOC123224703 isoform X2 n=1 Tax=Mangifera indica TaxID=29780 RepID=UPI001CF99DFE|nr:uncharacterized protein LOC123224703 isoform X2 [Mangifera indica]